MFFPKLYKLNESLLTQELVELISGPYDKKWEEKLKEYRKKSKENEGSSEEELENEANEYVQKTKGKSDTLKRQDLELQILVPLLKSGKDNYLQINHLSNSWIEAIRQSMSKLEGSYRYDEKANKFLQYVYAMKSCPDKTILKDDNKVDSGALTYIASLIEKGDLQLKGNQLKIFTDPRIFQYGSNYKNIYDLLLQMTSSDAKYNFNPEVLAKGFEPEGVFNQMLNTKDPSKAIDIGLSIKSKSDRLDFEGEETTKGSRGDEKSDEDKINKVLKLSSFKDDFQKLLSNEEELSKVLSLIHVNDKMSTGEIIRRLITWFSKAKEK